MAENLNKTFNEVLNTKSISADTTLANTDSGKLLLIDASSAGNITITLPSVEDGLVVEAVLVAASNAAAEVLFDAGSGKTIAGNCTFLEILNTGAGKFGNVNAAVSAQTVGFTDEAIVGSRIKIVCNGTGWFIIHAQSAPAMITSFS
jgi:hypothetical protein